MSEVTFPKIASNDGKNLTQNKKKIPTSTRVKNSQSSARKTVTKSVKRPNLDMSSEIHQPTLHHSTSKHSQFSTKQKKNVTAEPARNLLTAEYMLNAHTEKACSTPEGHTQGGNRTDDQGKDKDEAGDQLEHCNQTAERNEIALHTADYSVAKDDGAITQTTRHSTSMSTTTTSASVDDSTLGPGENFPLSLFPLPLQVDYIPKPFYRLSNDYLRSNTSQKLVDNVDEYLTDIAYVREKLISASVEDHIKFPQTYSLGFRYV